MVLAGFEAAGTGSAMAAFSAFPASGLGGGSAAIALAGTKTKAVAAAVAAMINLYLISLASLTLRRLRNGLLLYYCINSAIQQEEVWARIFSQLARGAFRTRWRNVSRTGDPAFFGRIEIA
jgi:hypothetical protein